MLNFIIKIYQQAIIWLTTSTMEQIFMLTKELYTRAEAADFLGVKTNTLAVWAATKRYDLSYIKVGSKAMYLKKDLDRFLENHRINMEEGNIWRQSA